MNSSISSVLALSLALLGGRPAGAQHEPFIVHDRRPAILTGPYLVAPAETSATVAWTTDMPCHSQVLYDAGDGSWQLAENPDHGLLPIRRQHAIRIGGLKPGVTYRYRTVSTGVVKMNSYWPEKSLPVEGPIYSFTTLDRKKPSISFSLITDTHADVPRINALAARVDWKTTEFLVHLGDTADGLENEAALLAGFIDPLSKVLAHVVPLVFVRGNHEARGPAARSLMDFVPIEEGRFHYARDHGPVHFVVLDTGEDKDDKTNVYARLNRFKAYREAEFAWFERHARTDERMSSAPFRVLLMHAPNWGWVDGQGDKWTALANSAKIDLAVCGHTHRYSHNAPGQKGKGYHELVLAPDTVARVDAVASELKVAVVKKDGAPVESFTVRARK